MKTAQHLVSRPKAGLDAEKLLAKGPGSIGSDLRAFFPPLHTISYIGLVRGNGVAWEEVCLGEKSKEDRS